MKTLGREPRSSRVDRYIRKDDPWGVRVAISYAPYVAGILLAVAALLRACQVHW